MAAIETKTERSGLGTFAGVFTPSIMTILGIILFLRVAYVVGSVGLLVALVIVVAANVISVLTSFSVAGIATNLRVKGGGDYYLISRTLGVEFGGAIGLVLFLAQSIAVGFYAIGFAEAAAALAGTQNGIVIRLVAGIAVFLLFIVAWKGNDWATRFQFAVMALITAALLSFAFGVASQWSPAYLSENLPMPSDHLPFWVTFAVFFPAVTGFTQGVSMSGDLRDPSKSIPRGTFLAVGLSFVIYVAVAVALAGALPGQVLREDYGAMRTAAAWGPLIDLGVFSATLSSALASFLGAPRILQSLAKDRVFPLLQSFAAGSGDSQNPRRAMALSGLIALAVVGVGELNLIASIVTMFFLLSYALLNYATYYEAQTKSPSFRPTFTLYNSRLSLLGSLACLGAMLAIDPASAMVALVFVAGIYQYVRSRDIPSRWADSRRSYHLQKVREHLLAAAAESEHPRNWRPQLLVFSDDAARRERILRFASWIEGGSGITTVVRIIESRQDDVVAVRAKALQELCKELSNGDFDAFPLVLAGHNLDDAIAAAIQAAGIGPIRGNTVIANWRRGMPAYMGGLGAGRYGRNLRTAFRLGCNLLVLDANQEEWAALMETPPHKRRIDIWWADNKTGDLMLLLAHIMTRGEMWQSADIRVLVAAGGEGETERFVRIKQKIADTRIEAQVVSVDGSSDDVICTRSREASIVYLPFTIRGGHFYHLFGGKVHAMIDRLPIVVLSLASQDVALDTDPDEGAASDIAEASDALADAVREIEYLRNELRKVRQRIIRLQERRAALDDESADDEGTKLASEEAQTKLELSELVARLGVERQKMVDAEKRLASLGQEIDDEDGGKTRSRKGAS